MKFTLGSIFSTLDMTPDNGLSTTDSNSLTTFQTYFAAQVKAKIGLDAVYYLRDSDGVPRIPLIYFKAMDTYDSERIAELHRLAWNTGEAPLLFIVLPDQLLIYNNYELPATPDMAGKIDNEKGLFERITSLSSLEEQRQQLLQFHRSQLETGEFWALNRKRFSVNTRVDATLIDNLKAIRRTLLTNIKHRDTQKRTDSQQLCEIVHSLLGRSILIKYLEERTDSNNQSVFPGNFFQQYVSGATEYADVLADKDGTYRLFNDLESKFNGDIFPIISNEQEVITQDDLLELQQFLLGTSDLATHQTALWSLYSFNAIPIQLISSIYELFFHLAEADTEKDNGTYYTPYHLVEMLMDEVLPWEGYYVPRKVLDPACGSGIFLVEAYRRLVAQWMYTNHAAHIQPKTLIKILEDCIFGVDNNKEAIRIASFSLSLAMCDFLDPRTIWDDLQFPRMLYYNLFHADFFDSPAEFEKIEFSLVIGNPPWESKLSPAAEKYIVEHHYSVSDKQVAQAFAWRAGDVCPDGDICFLLPSKPILFNRSVPARKFRAAFFSRYNVSVIINFSAFRHVLFEHATCPAIGIIYNSNKPDNISRFRLYYCTPKPQYTIEDRRRFLIEPNCICRIPQDLLSNDLIWKVAMWGSPRDLDLISTLQSAGGTFRKLFDDNHMVYAEGYKRGSKETACTDFLGLPKINARTFQPGKNSPSRFPTMDETKLERTVKTKREIFLAPHLIIKQSHKGTRFLADVLSFDAVFNHSLLGVHGDELILKYCCLIISSKVFSYYQMMTNRKWLIERDEVEAGDILDAPIPYPTLSNLSKAEELFPKLSDGQSLAEIDQFVYSLYNLHSYEIDLINDAIDYTYDYYTRKESSLALLPPTRDMITAYCRALHGVMSNTIGSVFNSSYTVYQSNAPLVIVTLNLSSSASNSISYINDSEQMNNVLATLDHQLLENHSGSVYIRRNVRIYETNSISIVKPCQRKYWNLSSAYRDADEIYADVMRAWRSNDE